ncbi:MAG: IPExxxVDY family protein [Flavobacteriaceae bacterium]|nr:IPExxxVDY family protein [Flavobacteriaceae bacterium]MCY4267449.1 IPExxxVDY family protein [Flavobacteriaceae bacterium]MCY4299133.1 IPExxxVDY family protein [Flavobacteriaceae bacterium]
MSKKRTKNRKPLRLDVDFTEPFWLIGIQSELEVFELVYHINLLSHSKFKRTNQDILLENSDCGWPLYQWQQFENSKPEYIFSNWFESIETHSTKSYGLLKDFETPWMKKVFLLTEFNQMDYFVKLYINHRVELLVEKIHEIGGVSLHLVISHEQVKTPEILIFD